MREHLLKGEVGFPEMWKPVAATFEPYFRSATKIEELHNKVVNTPVQCQPAVIIGHIVKVMFNDYGAVLVLVLNGYGVQAMKIARSMFEAECNILYLKTNPVGVEDYIDFHVIDERRLYDLLGPDQQKNVDPARVARMTDEYNEVAQRFARNKKGDLRDSWCNVSIYERAKLAGVEDLYQTFYKWASSMHHADLGSVISSFDIESEDVATAPSFHWLEQALVAAHGSMVRAYSHYLEVANIGLQKEIETIRDDCMRLFGGRKLSP
jgi:Family of unknown function (DUF5677)